MRKTYEEFKNEIRQWIKETKPLIHYVKNEKGQRCGTVVAFAEDGKVWIGWSRCHLPAQRSKKQRFLDSMFLPDGDVFDKYKGIHLARKHACLSVPVFFDPISAPISPSKELPSCMKESILRIQWSARRYFKQIFITDEEKAAVDEIRRKLGSPNH